MLLKCADMYVQNRRKTQWGAQLKKINGDKAMIQLIAFFCYEGNFSKKYPVYFRGIRLGILLSFGSKKSTESCRRRILRRFKVLD